MARESGSVGLPDRVPYQANDPKDTMSWELCSPNHLHQGELYAKARYVLAFDPELQDMAIVKMSQKRLPQADPILEIHIEKYLGTRQRLREIHARDSRMWNMETYRPKPNHRL